MTDAYLKVRKELGLIGRKQGVPICLEDFDLANYLQNVVIVYELDNVYMALFEKCM